MRLVRLAILIAWWLALPCLGGNNFGADPNCQGLWRFENNLLDGLSTDNDLTDEGSLTYSGTCREGSYAAVFDGATDVVSITDAELSADYPLKAGADQNDLTICFWMRMDTLPLFNTTEGVYWKDGALQIGLWADSEGVTKLEARYYNNLGSWSPVAHTEPLSAETWYHVSVALYKDGQAQRGLIHIEDESGATVGEDQVISVSSKWLMSSSGTVRIGRSLTNRYFHGLLDEFVVFNDVLTLEEMQAVAAGTYGVTHTTSQPMNAGLNTGLNEGLQ